MDRWITLSRALGQVSEAIDSKPQAKRELLEAFKWGEIHPKAEKYTISEKHRLPEVKRLHEIEPSFFAKATIDWANNRAEIGREYFEDGYLVSWSGTIEAEGIMVNASEVRARWLGGGGQDGKAKPGPKTKYEWEEMLIEACRLIYANGLPQKQDDLSETLLQWFGDKFDEQPSSSLVKARVSKIYKALRQSNN